MPIGVHAYRCSRLWGSCLQVWVLPDGAHWLCHGIRKRLYDYPTITASGVGALTKAVGTVATRGELRDMTVATRDELHGIRDLMLC